MGKSGAFGLRRPRNVAEGRKYGRSPLCTNGIHDQDNLSPSLVTFSKKQERLERTKSMPLSQKWYRCKQKTITKRQRKAYQDLWPRYGIEFKYNTTFDLIEIFPTNQSYRRAILDIGFGTGDSLLYTALTQTDAVCIGCDLHRAGIAQAMARLHEHQVTNTRIVRGDASVVVSQHMASHSLDEIHVYFPDPWPDVERDVNRRIIRPNMVTEFARILRHGGLLRLTTDVEAYAEYAQAVFASHQNHWTLSGLHRSEPSLYRPVSHRPITKYCQKALEEARPIIDMEFQLAKITS